MDDDTTTKGPYTGQTYRAKYHDTVKCWHFTFEDGRSYSVGLSTYQHATPEAALAQARTLDLLEAARDSWSALSRDAYEALCNRLGLVALPDADVDSYAVEYFEADFTHGGVLAAANLIAHKRRLKAIKLERAAIKAQQPQTVVAPKLWAFSERGNRNDERCDGCRRVVDFLDNATDLCARCYGEARP